MTAPHMPMMNDKGLLECPFCGRDDVRQFKDERWHFVVCQDCGCRTDDWFSNDMAKVKWNTRNGHLWTKQDFKDAAWERQNSDLLEGKS